MTLQIKRRWVGASEPPATLASGQLAYDGVGGILYIGTGDDGSGMALDVEPIAGPGFFATDAELTSLADATDAALLLKSDLSLLTERQYVNYGSTLGADVAVNGGFAADASGWTLGTGWAWSAGQLVCDLSAPPGTLTQILPATTEATFFQITWTQWHSIAGNCEVQVSIGAPVADTRISYASPISYQDAAGHTVYAVVIASTNPAPELRFTVTNPTGGTLTIDNVTVKELVKNTAWTAAYGNVFLGANAGRSLQVGQGNTAIGYQAGLALTRASVDWTTIVGSFAGYANANGKEVAFFGHAAGKNNLDGGYVVAVGSYAGYGQTSGDRNVYMGYQSGRYKADGVTPLRTAWDSIYIGPNTRGFSNADNNSIVIGANAIGAGANTAVWGGANITANYFRGGAVYLDSATGAVRGRLLYDGSANTASGLNTLSSLTSGTNNTATGSEALKADTSGADNVAVGYQALFANTTANSNTAVGSKALSVTTTGGLNTAVGYQALNANTVAGNTAVGSGAGKLISTGGSNTVVGTNAMTNNTTGAANTATGANAMQNLASGANNTASGSQSLLSNTTGGNNTAMGQSALRYATAPVDSVAIGYDAGSKHADGVTLLTAVTSGVYIGARARALDNNDNNSIVIGAGAIGAGANTAVWGNTAVTKHVFNGVMDFNTDTMRMRVAKTPASAIAAGNAGEWCWDANYIYVCIAANTWRRIAHATW